MLDRKGPAPGPAEGAEEASPAQIERHERDVRHCLSPTRVADAPRRARREGGLLGGKDRMAAAAAHSVHRHGEIAHACGQLQVDTLQIAQKDCIAGAHITQARRPFDALGCSIDLGGAFEADG